MNEIHFGKILKPRNCNCENDSIERKLIELGCKYFKDGIIKPTDEVKEKDKTVVEYYLYQLKIKCK